ncbi:MAG: DUF1707 domain-containing protein [Actinomycetota bacterium]|nr:DUF1707 domain-containing protein [Actinomycetota bacterium]
MTASPGMRAGDEDRDRVIAVLREAFAEGRLTDAEFTDRLGRAQQARTFGDLDALTADLPTSMPVMRAALPVPGSGAAGDGAAAEGPDMRKAWAVWLGVSVLVNVIWWATWLTNPGSFPPYWPIWVMGPWGAALIITYLVRRSARPR